MDTRDRKAALSDHLRREVLTLGLAPGADIDEATLCARFELSRTPVREVLRELAGLGLLDMREGRGARVAELSPVTLRDFFLAAPMIYAAILRLAAANARPAQLEALKAAQREFRASLRGGDVAARTLANVNFHATTGEMAGNVYLRPSFERLLVDHARIGMIFYRPRSDAEAADLAAAADQHDAMIAAIETHDETRAEGLAEEHWALSRTRIGGMVLPDPLDHALGTLRTTG